MDKINFYENPEILNRTNSSLFKSMPLYKSVKNYKAVYVNQSLFFSFFDKSCDFSWKKISQFIENNFNITINILESTKEKIGLAYVDYQADPLNLSLSGNLGSGRAYYFGKNFNLKGEKTPLATSSIKHLSDGKLIFDQAIRQTLVSNTLYQDLNIPISPIIAILSDDEPYLNPKDNLEYKSAKIIRLDTNKSLDRFSHMCYLNNKISEDKLLNIIIKCSKLEAIKYAERILHGSWSVGNSSQYGGMIDFDAVFAVKGRNPLYSVTPWFVDNYFGYETNGMMKAILALLKDKQIYNLTKSETELELFFYKNYKKELLKLFIKLMGFIDIEILPPNLIKKSLELLDLWIELSGKFLPLSHELYVNNDDFVVIFINYINNNFI